METRAVDWQALQRRIALKQRDGGVDHVILVLADTRNNRSFVREHEVAVQVSFPIPGRAALLALREGADVGGNAIMLL